MHVPRYWEVEERASEFDGGPFTLRAWGHSDASPGDARAVAIAKLERMDAALRAGRMPDRYAYSACPIREQQVERFGPEDAPHALVTRNGYGALVLNTARVAFVDIDPKPAGFFARLFGGANAKDVARRAAEETARAKGISMRVYETHAGLRLLLTDRLREPASSETQGLLRDFDADPLYARLCRAQSCFRARLTPKPWRLGIDRPPLRFPGSEPPASYLAWCREYERRSRGFPACRHLGSVGAPSSEPEIAEVIQAHDRAAGVGRPGELR